MSDNPADSLREQLERVNLLQQIEDLADEVRSHGAIASRAGQTEQLEALGNQIAALGPRVSAGLAAARADEREKIEGSRQGGLQAARELAALTPDEWCELEAFEPAKVNELRDLLRARPAGVEPKEPSDG